MNISRILCPTDFSDASEHAIELSLLTAATYHARIAAMHVAYPFVVPLEFAGPSRGSLDDAEINTLREQTRARASGASQAGIDVQILEVAADESSDLIIVGVHGRNPVDMSLFGSTANQIVRRATCPVLTLRR